MSAVKTSDSNLYNSTSENFVPVACHYDEHTLLTKNGELLQTIQINGIHSEKISKNLFNLREVVRAAIRDTIGCNKFAFWIHTIRRKDDLDDAADYKGLLSANVHDIWRRKNYWHDKFVNRLYITVVHNAPELKLKNFNSLVNSLSPNIITVFEEKFFAKAAEKLTEAVDSILSGVGEYGAQRLGIRMEGQECYSDPMFLYRRIMQLNEEDCPVPVSDILSALASHQYAVGSDKIEVIGEDGKKFAALMSIKEYQEVSSEALDRFLQIPVEMVATEIFYFVERNEVTSVFEDQDYILGVSGDSDLKQLKGLDVIINEADDGVRFCHQQISFMVIGEDLHTLDRQVKQASEADKYYPTTIYITDDMDSGLYIKARGGKWFQRDKNIINPLMCEDTEENRKFMFEFFKIILKHYFDPLQDTELKLLEALSEIVFTMPIKDRKLSMVIQALKDSEKGGAELKARLEIYLQGGAYHGVFERDTPVALQEGGLVAINLQSFDDAAYTKANYPKEKKLIEQFEYDLNTMRAVKVAVFYRLRILCKMLVRVRSFLL